MQAVILAGGRGARMGALSSDTPKPMLPVCGVPVIVRQIQALRSEGITDITVVTGYLADRLETALGSGAQYGVRLRYYREDVPLGTAGALFRLDLQEDFLLLGGDLVFAVDFTAMSEFHRTHGAVATLFAHPSTHPGDSAVLAADETGRVTAFYEKTKKPALYSNLCNAGIAILSPALLRAFPHTGPADLDSDLLTPAAETGRVFAYRSAEYVKDMGTPQRLAAVESDLAAGIPEKRMRKTQKRAVFLDRDGTLNAYCGFVTAPEQLRLLPGAAQAVRRINRAGDLAVLVTNQAVAARGDCTLETLNEIHQKLELLLGEAGAFLDGIYVCPHHPEAGFPGENPALKTECDCRKPKPGLLLRAARELQIDLTASYMVGDTARDVQTALNAGCHPVFLRCGKPETVPQNVPVYDDLSAFTLALYDG